MVCLYKDPKGKNIFTAAQRSLRHHQCSSDKKKIDQLAARVRELESKQVTNDIKAMYYTNIIVMTAITS